MAHQTRYIDTPNRSVTLEGTRLAYRALGPLGGVPLVMLNH